MTLEEIVNKGGFEVVVQKVGTHAEPIQIISYYNDLTFLVVGQKTGAEYTELRAAEGYKVCT